MLGVAIEVRIGLGVLGCVAGVGDGCVVCRFSGDGCSDRTSLACFGSLRGPDGPPPRLNLRPFGSALSHSSGLLHSTPAIPMRCPWGGVGRAVALVPSHVCAIYCSGAALG